MLNHFSLLAVEQAIDRMTLGLRALAQLGPATESGHSFRPSALPAPVSLDVERRSGDSSWVFSSHPDGDAGPTGHWWVLAVNNDQDEELQRLSQEVEDTRLRALARERLRNSVRKAGLQLHEHCWVWDARGAAQLVLGTYEDRSKAMVNAVRFSGLGLRVRVARRV